MPSGYTSQLPSTVVLDTAVIYLNNSATPWAVVNGVQWDTGKEIVNIEFDGKRVNVAGLDRVVGFAPKLTGTLIQLNPTLVEQLEPGSTSATASGVTTITPKKAGGLLNASTDYQVVRAAFMLGDGTLAVVKFARALMMFSGIQGQDKSTASVPISIEARQDLSGGIDTDVAPYVWQFASTIPTA